MKDYLESLLVFGLLLLLTIIVSWPLFTAGWYMSHELADPLNRVIAISHEIENGFYYPRWLSLTYSGLGSPFSNFYSPGFYLVAAYLHFFGVPLLISLKILCCTLFLFGAMGMFLWTRRHYSTSGAILSAILYLFAPYHFVDIYVRGALAEFSALAFLPYLFLGIDLSFSEHFKFRGILLVIFSSAAILITHNLSLIMIAPFSMLYFIYSAFQTRVSLKTVIQIMAGPLGGIGISAFYWLPVLMERRYLKFFDKVVSSGYFSYSNHFVYLRQLFSTFWGVGYSLPGPVDEMSFQIGVVIIIVTLVAFAATLIKKTDNRNYLFVLLFLGILATFFTTAQSSSIYRIVPWFQFVQFPWRFLGPSTLFLAAFAGFAAENHYSGNRLFRFLPYFVVMIAIDLCLIFSVGQRCLSRQISGTEDLNSKQYELNYVKENLMGPLNSKNEYLPLWVSPSGITAQFSESHSLPSPRIHATLFASGADIDNVVIEGAKIAFDSVAIRATTVKVPYFFFPGWHVLIDGNYVKASPDDMGFISFKMPEGKHSVKVWFGSTIPRTVGRYITVITFCAIIGISAFSRNARKSF